MKIFIDTLDLKLIEKYHNMGILAGVTTNPTMQKKFKFDNDLDMVLGLLSTGKNLVFKIPFSEAGVYAVHRLNRMGYKTNMHLVYSLSQAIISSVVGATYICALAGRLDDIGQRSMETIAQMIGLGPKIMVSSVRHPQHVITAKLIGADAVTIPPDVLELMFDHPLTERGINTFEKDIEYIRGIKNANKDKNFIK